MRHLALILMILLGSVAWAATDLPLAEVSRFDGSAIGYAGSPSPSYAAFAAELEKGAAARPLFEQTLKEGTPAARLYAALGLYSLDKERGTAALQSLCSDSSPLQTMHGCLMSDTTVGAMAAELLKNDGEAAQGYLR